MLDTTPHASTPAAGFWRRALRRLPSACAVCQRWPTAPVCDACSDRFATSRARCGRCAIELPGGNVSCGACLREPPPLDACLAALDYAYPWDQLLTRFKFGGEIGLAGLFADLMLRDHAIAAHLRQAELLLPMPLAPRRLAERGFNQALELARRLAPRTRIDAGLLLRVRDTAPQSGLARAERLLNVRGAFAADPLRAARLRQRSVVLVDDVMTSGASLHSAARALREAGASSITAIVLARTPAP